jgi:Spy/CpxP family protein refolding chaperone
MALAGMSPSSAPAQDAAPAAPAAQQAAAQDQQPGQEEQAADRRRRRQQGGGGGQFGGGAARMEDVVKELDLTAEQKPKVEAIFAEMRTASQEARSLQGEERRQKMQQTQRDMREKLNAVLTAEQQQKLRTAMTKQQATQMTQRLRGAVGQLGLSQDQQTKVDAILSDTEKKVGELASQAQPQDAGNRGGGGREFRAAMQEARQKINEVLTPEQQTKFAELAPEGGRGQGQGGRRRNQQQPQ